MKPIFHSDVQDLIDTIENQILSIQKELTEEFDRKMTQRTGHLQEALKKLYRDNSPINYELTELEEISAIDQELGLYTQEDNNNE
jgi:vacuolar-type H+-ATPase subunit I/STV1